MSLPQVDVHRFALLTFGVELVDVRVPVTRVDASDLYGSLDHWISIEEHHCELLDVVQRWVGSDAQEVRSIANPAELYLVVAHAIPWPLAHG